MMTFYQSVLILSVAISEAVMDVLCKYTNRAILRMMSKNTNKEIEFLT